MVLIPSQAVIFNKDGLNGGVVSDGKLEIRKLDLDADDEAEVAVRAGINPGYLVILNPPINVVGGVRVKTGCERLEGTHQAGFAPRRLRHR